ncbi:hypothetical protein ABPG75_006070 [Micractinium tetrahymenae]
MAWASVVYGLTLCAVAGVSGAGAAVFGKLAGVQGIDTATQITCYALLIVCNALMLILYTRSLRYNSSLACTAATTAINISATGLLGAALFGEATSLQWWVGASSILVGSVFINRSTRKEAAAAAAAAEGAAQPAAAAEEQEEEEAPAKGAARRRTRRA